jgi:hypothetical protein
MLDAPKKQLIRIDTSGHRPLFEQSDLFHELMIKTVLPSDIAVNLPATVSAQGAGFVHNRVQRSATERSINSTVARGSSTSITSLW